MPFVTRKGVQLHYSEVGSGPAVFWHTGGGGDGTMWQTAGYLDQLPGWRHILFDHRGHGRSDCPEGLEAHRLEAYQSDVLAVMDAAGIERAAMVGYSDGGRVVYALAARHPERVAAVVGMGGVASPSETNAWRSELAAQVRQIGFRAWLEEMSSGETEPAPRWVMEHLAATPTEMFALECEGWADAPTEYSHFRHIPAPTLIICGELENTDGSAAQALEVLPDGRAVVLSGFGHLQTFWRSDLTAPRIRDFLDECVSEPERS
jgi:pimeloyl-ACP methyl ester carboxylesterase